MFRTLIVMLAVISLAACTNSDDLDQGPVALGNFELGHNIVVAPNLVKGPLSREATPEQWIGAVTKAIGERFDRYEGGKHYHLGISVEGYVLAQPGIPLVLSPKSILIINVTAWDDAAGKKLNEKVEQLTVFESASGDTLVGSGLTKSAEEQMENLSANAAKMIQNWLVRQNKSEKWFKPSPEEKAKLDAKKAEAVEATEEAPDATAEPVSEDASEETAEVTTEETVEESTEDAAEETEAAPEKRQPFWRRKKPEEVAAVPTPVVESTTSDAAQKAAAAADEELIVEPEVTLSGDE